VSTTGGRRTSCGNACMRSVILTSPLWIAWLAAFVSYGCWHMIWFAVAMGQYTHGNIYTYIHTYIHTYIREYEHVS